MLRAWHKIAQRNAPHCFYSSASVIINRPNITCKSVRHIFCATRDISVATITRSPGRCLVVFLEISTLCTNQYQPCDRHTVLWQYLCISSLTLLGFSVHYFEVLFHDIPIFGIGEGFCWHSLYIWNVLSSTHTSILCLTSRSTMTSARIPQEEACHRTRNVCVFSRIQKGTLGLTHKGCVLQLISLGAFRVFHRA